MMNDKLEVFHANQISMCLDSLTVPVRFFFHGSFVFFLSCVCCAFVRVCLCVPCGHLLGKSCSLGSRLWCLTVSSSLSHWYPGSGVVLNCTDS